MKKKVAFLFALIGWFAVIAQYICAAVWVSANRRTVTNSYTIFSFTMKAID